MNYLLEAERLCFIVRNNYASSDKDTLKTGVGCFCRKLPRMETTFREAENDTKPEMYRCT